MKKNKIVFFISIFISVSAIFSNAYSQHFLPIFSGNWYVDPEYQYLDSCSNSVYKYGNQAKGDIHAAAEKFLQDVPPHSDCEWEEATFEGTDAEKPYDFVGNTDDWDKIRSTSGAQFGSTWSRICKNKTGALIDLKRVTIWPSYVCPVGTRNSIEKVVEPISGCTNKPMACEADVVGQDLTVPIFGFLGHVGYTIPGLPVSMVVQVLAHPKEEISINLLDSFKHSGDPFWGEKYQLSNLPVLSLDKGTKIITTGIAQMNYPFEYTLTWDWHPGSSTTHYTYNQITNKWEKVLTANFAKFRCDSFVYYSYLTWALAI